MTTKHQLPCRQVDPDIFFPVGYTGPAAAQTELAKALCIPCPIQAECLRYALERNIEFGVWGGVSELERRAMLRRKPINGRINHGTRSSFARELASA